MRDSQPLILEPAEPATACVIWLHGLGADRYDFQPVAEALQQVLPDVRFVLPQAPTRPVTINGGWSMPAWYDILDMDDFVRRTDLRGIEQSVEQIRALITRENARGIPAGNIILAGFSQGGVISYITALTHPEALGGVMALSTYLPEAEHWQFHPANQATPIFAAHGGQDPVVPYALGKAAAETLSARHYAVDFRTYIMPHSVCPSEIRDIGQWLTARLTAA